MRSGGYTPVFRLVFALPGIELFRRPADATFLVGALPRILAGYLVHRCLRGTLPRAEGRAASRAEILIGLAAFAAAIGSRSPEARCTVGLAAIARSACVPRRRGSLFSRRLPSAGAQRRPLSATLVLVRVPRRRSRLEQRPERIDGACRPPIYEVLRPESRDPLLARLKGAAR